MAAKFTVEKHVPVPLRMRPTPWSTYPFSALGVGDSFFIKGDAKVVGNARNAASMHAKKFGVQFTTRQVENGVRIWRIT